MVSINSVTVGGNLTKDPELRYSSTGTPITSFSLAINESFKKGDEWVKEVLYVNCTIFAKGAENLCEWARKGDPILVEGRLKTNKWEGKDGMKHSDMVVIANRVHYLKEKDRSGDQGQNQPQVRKVNPQSDAGEPNPQHDDVVPF